MSTNNQFWELRESATAVGQDADWYAVLTRARHEKAAAHRLGERGVPTFLPTVTEVHRWNDRKKTVELPLFSCYSVSYTHLDVYKRQTLLIRN